MQERETHVAHAVASANLPTLILPTVAKNPLLKLYGSGHNRIMTKTPTPSRLSTWPSATNLRSCPTSLCT